jgi:general nucleoside transport system permease protein
MTDVFTNFLVSVISATTPLLLAATGELVVERSGVLNLGVEGMMLVGAVAAFAVAHNTGSTTLALGAAILTSSAMAMIFGFLTLTMLANQICAGLALTISGQGLSALVGAGFVGIAAPTLPSLYLPLLSNVPVLGPVLFSRDALNYLSFAILAGTSFFLYRTSAGLTLRAVGDSHAAAHALGYPVVAIRYLAILFGGAMAGLAGAYMSLSYSPLWAQDMTAGRGWIAVALVAFAAWRPFWLLGGAYLFGSIMYLSLYVQAAGVPIPPALVSMLTYGATILVLVIVSRDVRRIRLNKPATLGKPFHATS